jgi:hypothetical protein
LIAVAAPDAQHCHAGTLACSPELFQGNVEAVVSKLKRSEAGQVPDARAERDAWTHRVDSKLAGLFQAALEEPIPDDMLRMARMIAAQSPSKGGV